MRKFDRIKQLLDKRESDATQPDMKGSKAAQPDMKGSKATQPDIKGGRVAQFFAAPVFKDDEEKTRAANLLNAVLMTLLVATVVGTIALYWIEPTEIVVDTVFGIFLVLLIFGLRALIRRGKTRLVSLLLSIMLWAGSAFLVYAGEGVRDPSITTYFLVVAVAGLLLGGRAAVIFGLASILAILGFFYAQISGAFVPDIRPSAGPIDAVTLTTVLTLMTLLLRTAVRNINEGFGRAHRYAAELEQQKAHLEQTVEERTQDLIRRARYLEATAEVARDAASVLDLQELLSRTAALVSDRFAFYHTGIFLLDSTGEWAVLHAAASEGGRRMLAREHRLRVGAEGIVGFVTAQGQPRIALDVGKDAVFFDNPDLPDTRSEMALPLQARGEIIGALDVQSTEPTAFSQEDVAVLQTLADQVAMAISNTRLFQQAQERLEAERRAYGEIVREAWAEAVRARPDLGVISNEQGIYPVENPWQSDMVRVTQTGEIVRDGGPTVVLPVRIRDHVVGAVRLRKPDDADQWTDEELALTQTLTDQLSVALESARLYQDAQRRATRERLIGEVTDRVRETLDIETILKTGAREVRQALDLPEVVVRLVTRPDAEPRKEEEKQDGEIRTESAPRTGGSYV